MQPPPRIGRSLPDSIGKLAIVRANGLGDYFFSEPALAALRARFPNAEIVLLGRPLHQQLLRDRPGPIDRVVTIPDCPGVGVDPEQPADTAGLAEFFAAMNAERFDLAVQLHGGGRYSNPFTRRLGARYAIGLRAADADPLDACIPYYYFQPEVLRYLEVVSLVGARPLRLEPHFTVLARDRMELDALGLPTDQPWVVLHPGATDNRRRWPAESFAAVGDRLAARGAHIVVNGTGNERTVVEDIVARLRAPATTSCDRLSVGGLAALLEGAHLVVANDSGPLHLARAVGTRTLGFYWCGNFINGGPMTRLHHDALMSWRLDCPECGRNTLTDNCDHRASFIADIPVAEAHAAADRLYTDAEAQAQSCRPRRRVSRA